MIFKINKLPTISLIRSYCHKIKRMTDVMSDMKHLVGFVGNEKSIDINYLQSQLPHTQDELSPRFIKDSLDTALIPLKNSDLNKIDYFLPNGEFRYGKLLEDMDVFSVWIAYKHIHLDKMKEVVSPYVIVTALISDLNFLSIPQAGMDIEVSGHVSWVGKSSLEVMLEVYHNNQVKIPICQAVFVLVARDTCNARKAFVNPLEYNNEKEKEKFISAKFKRAKNQQKSLFMMPPSSDEKKIIHDQYIKTSKKYIMSNERILPENYVWIENTLLKKMVVCHPESSNIHGKLFGGFILRMADEVARCNAYMFSSKPPILKHMEDIEFLKPVEIGSLLFFETKIAYTNEDWVMVQTSAEVLNPNSGMNSLTNRFYFLFQIENCSQQVMPHSYSDSMLYLDGRRRLLAYLNSIE